MSGVQPTDDDPPATPAEETASPSISPTSSIVRYGERGHSRTSSWGSVRTTVVSKQFPNGDSYTGDVAAGVPHGKGRYMWREGSSYDGDWSAGKKHGKGMFQWPSQAVYEGDWMGGVMEGWGTYRSPNGESYRGSWHLNQKHGLGKKKYANGDVYDGLWQNGAFEGPGRYIWANGNSYSGNWRGGKMDGRGIFVWANRDRYDGEWAGGRENGKGVFTWADGAVFEGSWLNGLRHGRGVYYPPGALRSRKGSRKDLMPPRVPEETPTSSGDFGAGGQAESEDGGASSHEQQAAGNGMDEGKGDSIESGEEQARTGANESQASDEAATKAAGSSLPEDSPGQDGEAEGNAPKLRSAKVTSFSDWNAARTPLVGVSEASHPAGIPEAPPPGDKTIISSPPPASHRRSISADGNSFSFPREGSEPLPEDGRFLTAASPFGSRNSALGLTYDSDTTLSESSFGDSQSGASTPVYSPLVPRSRLASQRPPVPRPGDGLARDLFGQSSGSSSGVQNGTTIENGSGHATPEEDSANRRLSGMHAGAAARQSVDMTLARNFGGGRGEGGVRRVVVREYVEGKLVSEEEQAMPEAEPRGERVKRHSRRGTREVKRPGETIFKGHRSYDLMLNLQTGIRYTVGKITPEKFREIRPSDFKAQMSQRFPPNGSSTTPPHRSHDFKWKDYCPMVFRHLRDLFGTDAADYMMSLTGSDALRELSSPGKSGSVFYLSHDDRFLIKTMRKTEMHVLLNMLPAYYQHVRTHDNTLLTKFFGLHRIKPAHGRKVRFMVMGNMFHTDLRIDARFDLKGSSHGRATDPAARDAATTLKDLDLDMAFKLEEGWRERLARQLAQDCDFLQKLHIMDYSLLLGVHYRDIKHESQLSTLTEESAGGVSTFSAVTVDDGEEEVSTLTQRGGAFTRLGTRGAAPRLPYGMNGHVIAAMAPDRTDTLRPVLGSRGGTDALAYSFGRSRVQLGVNMAATALPKNERQDSAASQGGARDVVLYFGIIDILQEWDVSKRVEHTYKSLKFGDSQAMSAVDPRTYSQRFQDYIGTLFL